MKNESNINQHQLDQFSDEIDLMELWGIIWNKKLIIIAAAVGVGILSLAFSFQFSDIYRADALLSPVSDENETQISAQLGLAANFAGVEFANPTNRKVKALATLRSREFAEKFITEHDLLPWLFASKYDVTSGKSIIDPNLYETETGNWLGVEEQTVPSTGEAFERFSEILSVVEQESTGLVTVAIEWSDPVLAAEWVNSLILDLNNHIKEADMQEAQLAINYLQRQLESTQLLDMQRVFYQLIESQTRTLMLADIREGYVFEVIDPAVVPEKKSWPSRLLFGLIGTLVGGLVAVVVFTFIHYSPDKGVGSKTVNDGDS